MPQPAGTSCGCDDRPRHVASLAAAARYDGPMRAIIQAFKYAGHQSLGASLAEGAQITDDLLAIARDRARPRETRRQAIAYAGREVENGNANAQRVTGRLSALQAEGEGRVISTPRIIATNQKEARILQGTEIPYQESSSSGATTVSFKEAVLSMSVTPQITPDNRIIMDLVVTKDSVGEVVSSGQAGGFIPSIDTRELTTQVHVNDGETVVLGGVYETELRSAVTKVPGLGNIPGIGYLFRSRTQTNNNAELLIFVTPKIIREGTRLN